MSDRSLQRVNRLKDMFSLYKNVGNLCLLLQFQQHFDLFFFPALGPNLTPSQINRKINLNLE